MDATRRLVDFIQRPFKRYRQLHRKKQMVVQALAFIASGMIVMNILFVAPFCSWSLTLVEWNMLVFSSTTSVAAVYFVLLGSWRYYDWIDLAKEEIHERLGIPFIRNLADFGKRLDERFVKLTPEQRERVLNLIDKIVDRGFDRISELAEPRPKPERKKIKKMGGE
ncbi:hypothetical protein ES703_77864 [subsurface metagenome]